MGKAGVCAFFRGWFYCYVTLFLLEKIIIQKIIGFRQQLFVFTPCSRRTLVYS